MKLKYYMRGLGLGIILTTIIFTIANPKEKLSDAQIKERAQELGMELKEDSGLDKAMEKLDLTLTPAPAQTAEKKPEAKPTPTQSIWPSLTPAAATQAPTAAPTRKPAKSAKSKLPDNEITFTIKDGMSSRKVAKLLEEKGIIEDASDFNKYIQKKGKEGVIRVGTYSLTKNANYDIIIKFITKGK